MELQDLTGPATDKVSDWFDQLIAMLPNIVAAVVALILFWIAARIAKRILESMMRRTTRNPQITAITANVLYVAVLAGGLMVALGILQLEKTVTSMLAGAGIIGLALGFAFQDLAANLMSGVMLATSEPLRNGDLVRTNDYFGTIQSVHMRYSILRTFDGQLVRIPNKMLFDEPLTNYTQPGERRIEFDVGVSYGDDLERAREIAIAAVSEIEERDRQRDVEIYYVAFDDYAIRFSLRFWIDFPDHDFLQARSEAIVRVKRAFDEAGITIPFPIRTLDFETVGGRTLAQAIPRSMKGSSS